LSQTPSFSQLKFEMGANRGFRVLLLFCVGAFSIAGWLRVAPLPQWGDLPLLLALVLVLLVRIAASEVD